MKLIQVLSNSFMNISVAKEIKTYGGEIHIEFPGGTFQSNSYIIENCTKDEFIEFMKSDELILKKSIRMHQE